MATKEQIQAAALAIFYHGNQINSFAMELLPAIELAKAAIEAAEAAACQPPKDYTPRLPEPSGPTALSSAPKPARGHNTGTPEAANSGRYL